MSLNKAIQRKRKMILITCYQGEIRYKEKENAFIKNCECGLLSLVFVIELGEIMTEIFSEDRQGHEDLTEFITM